MNKELIEKLESVGFSKKEQAGNVLSLHIKGLKFLYYIGIDEFCVHRNDVHAITIKSPSFAEILKTVEELSNVELRITFTYSVSAEKVFKRLEQLGFYKVEGVPVVTHKEGKEVITVVGLALDPNKTPLIIGECVLRHYSNGNRIKDLKNPSIEEAEHYIQLVFGKDFISKQQGNGLLDVARSEEKPKQTKTQRISQLENQIEVLTTNLQKVEDMVKDKSLIVDENTKAINKNKELIKQEVNDLNSLRALVLEINARLNKLERNNSLDVAQKVLETTKEIGNLALELKKLDMQDGGFVEKKEESNGRVLAKAEGNENILTKKQAETLTDKPKFKVGDEVVITDFSNTRIDIDRLKQAVLNKEAFNIYEIDEHGICFIYIDGESRSFNIHELKHAPKFKVGDEVMISENVIDDECCPRVAFSAKKKNVFKISQTDSDGKHCLDASYLGWFSSDLLIPVAKDSQTKKTNFEIFDHAIVNTSKRDFKEGIEVVLVRSKVSLIDNVEYKMWCCYDKTGAYEYYYEEDLKPL